MELAIHGNNEFGEYIVTSMRDNEETMLECLIREADYFLGCKYPSKGYTCLSFYEKNGATFLETEFRKYLREWHLTLDDENFYVDIFMGRKPDLMLQKNVDINSNRML